MIIVNCSKLCFSYGTNKILDNISFNIQQGDKASLVGVNGAGKSTLFKLITGELHPDDGDIYTSRDLKIGYLHQNADYDPKSTIWEEVLFTFAHLIKMEERLKHLESRISTEKKAECLESLMKEYSSLSDRFSFNGGYEYTSRSKGVLRGLGFSDEEFDLRVRSLSGGQKTRLSLAKLLLEEPDLLLLDEPTNHLDMDSLEWLEDFLKSYKKTIVAISHDRYFLDVVTTKTIELENSKCVSYNGNYSEYVRLKEINREIQQKHYELQQKEIARMEAFIEQQRRWNRERNIIAAESRQKAIDRMEKLDKPKNLPGKINIKFQSSVTTGNDVLFVDELSKSYPGKQLFKNISFNLKKNETAFLLGPNGCGKSTILKILCGKLGDFSGTFEYGHNTIIGYYDQEHEDLNQNNSIIEEVWNANERLDHTQVRNLLAAFLFKGEDVLRNISTLSGGEKSRVALAKLILSGANFLFLDEPTNHLDINSREVLENALKDFEGTILAVSHDRYFINKLATRVLEIKSSSLTDFKGTYSEFVRFKQRSKEQAAAMQTDDTVSSAKLSHIMSKEEKSRQRKLEKQLAETESEIAELEARQESLKSEMESSSTDHLVLLQLHDEQVAINTRLEGLYELWEKLATKKEAP